VIKARQVAGPFAFRAAPYLWRRSTCHQFGIRSVAGLAGREKRSAAIASLIIRPPPLLGVDGSVIGTSRDTITDFNTLGTTDVLTFGASTTVLAIDATAAVAGVNVQTSAGGLITFAAADNTLALKIAAVQADAELDVANSIAMFVDSGNTYVYYAGAAAGNADDQLIELLGITSLTTITGGATTTIA
jgi:hypothetical protein